MFSLDRSDVDFQQTKKKQKKIENPTIWKSIIFNGLFDRFSQNKIF